MTDRRRLIHAIFLGIAPLIVAWFGLSVPAALALVALLLLWRWLVVLSGYVVPEKKPELELETISASHFVEKVRWCMDRLGLDYQEKPVGGTLGAFYLGRTVPQLKIRTGAVRSVIGNSPDILRYLWGRYGQVDPATAAFLRPDKNRIALEQRLDKYGAQLQVWVYYRILDDRALTLRAWGCDDPNLPRWQRWLLKVIYPLQAALVRWTFRITDERFARAVAQIESLLAEMNDTLGDERGSLLGGDELNYTDITFAALSGLWLSPDDYGGGKAEAVRRAPDSLPEPMQMDIDSWSAAYPHAVALVSRLYEKERVA